MPLSWLLIFGGLGLPALGTRGAGIAVVDHLRARVRRAARLLPDGPALPPLSHPGPRLAAGLGDLPRDPARRGTDRRCGGHGDRPVRDLDPVHGPDRHRPARRASDGAAARQHRLHGPPRPEPRRDDPGRPRRRRRRLAASTPGRTRRLRPGPGVHGGHGAAVRQHGWAAGPPVPRSHHRGRRRRRRLRHPASCTSPPCSSWSTGCR